MTERLSGEFANFNGSITISQLRSQSCVHYPYETEKEQINTFSFFSFPLLICWAKLEPFDNEFQPMFLIKAHLPIFLYGRFLPQSNNMNVRSPHILRVCVSIHVFLVTCTSCPRPQLAGIRFRSDHGQEII